MIKIDAIQKCSKCGSISTINKVFIQEVEEEKLFCKEYLCNCGQSFIFIEVIDFIVNKELLKNE